MTDPTCPCSSHQQPRCAHFRMGHCAEKPMPEGVAKFPTRIGVHFYLDLLAFFHLFDLCFGNF